MKLSRIDQTDACCNICGSGLSEHNWNPSHKKASDYRCKTCFNTYLKEYRSRNPDIFYKSFLKRKYGITYEEYLIMFNEQNGKCFICGEAEPVKREDKSPRWLSVDHCHKTGKVRKLLCTKCNHGLGNFNDNPDLLKRACEYVQNQ